MVQLIEDYSFNVIEMITQYSLSMDHDGLYVPSLQNVSKILVRGKYPHDM